jgi:hypothetical protein
MNAKDVLNKIAIALSLVKEEVLFTDAKLADGTILQSPTFDLGEMVEVVHEDGTKTPAPDGEHEVVLKDSEGNDVRIQVQTQDGKIVERSNVEEETPATDEAVKMDSMAGDDISTPETPDAEVKEPQDIPQTMSEVYEKLSYRIEELEKKMMEMVKEDLIDSTKPAEKVKVQDNSSMMSAVDGGDDESDDETTDEEELPKLDGAPVEEEATKLSAMKTNYGKKSADSQSTFLSKLYK